MAKKSDTDSQFQLFSKKRFAPLFCTQFLGAFNDNMFKNALITMIAFTSMSWTKLDTNIIINIAGGLFVLPFLLFSASAGQLADKYEKATLIRYIKLLEILIMLFATVGFYLHSLPMLIAVLFFLGFQSTLFGPLKYSILPQHLAEAELVGGNGMIEMGTFVAILLGTIAGGLIVALQKFTLHPLLGPMSGATWISLALIFIAMLGFISSCFIPRAESKNTRIKMNWNIVSQSWKIIGYARENRVVFNSVLGISWFWFLGTVFFYQIPNYTKTILNGNNQVYVLMMATFAIGIGLGSALCEKLSDRRIEIGLVPFGSIGLSLFALNLAFNPHSGQTHHVIGAVDFLHDSQNWWFIINLALLGVFGGFYSVPLYALVQQRSKPERRSQIIAANNILNALLMVLATLWAVALLKLGISIPQLFVLTAIANALVAVYIFTLVPEFLMRFITWIIISLLYRIKKSGLENIPDRGAAVLISNHISFIDVLIIIAIVKRPIRFVMHHHLYHLPVLHFVFKTGKAIPIAPEKESPEIKDRAFELIAEALEQGDLVAIFPEDGLTRDGEMMPFRSGIERIIQRTPVPVIPLALQGLWGSFFSRKYGKAMTSIPRRLWMKVGVQVGELVPPEKVERNYLQELVLKLRGEWK